MLNEPKTECYAIQTMDDLALELGATPREAKMLQALALPDSRSLRRARVGYSAPIKCRSGGAYDLTPGDGVWP